MNEFKKLFDGLLKEYKVMYPKNEIVVNAKSIIRYGEIDSDTMDFIELLKKYIKNGKCDEEITYVYEFPMRNKNIRNQNINSFNKHTIDDKYPYSHVFEYKKFEFLIFIFENSGRTYYDIRGKDEN
jgi:hypothetical protein